MGLAPPGHLRMGKGVWRGSAPNPAQNTRGSIWLHTCTHTGSRRGLCTRGCSCGSTNTRAHKHTPTGTFIYPHTHIHTHNTPAGTPGAPLLTLGCCSPGITALTLRASAPLPLQPPRRRWSRPRDEPCPQLCGREICRQPRPGTNTAPVPLRCNQRPPLIQPQEPCGCCCCTWVEDAPGGGGGGMGQGDHLLPPHGDPRELHPWGQTRWRKQQGESKERVSNAGLLPATSKANLCPKTHTDQSRGPAGPLNSSPRECPHVFPLGDTQFAF